MPAAPGDGASVALGRLGTRVLRVPDGRATYYQRIELAVDKLVLGDRWRSVRTTTRDTRRFGRADSRPVGAAGELAVHFAHDGLAAEAYVHSVAAAQAAEVQRATNINDIAGALERELLADSLIAPSIRSAPESMAFSSLTV